jgi:C4-dicarboxylate-specific signal transduction histidine kinase
VEDDPSATRPENPKGLRATVQQTLDNVKRSNPDYESVCVINKVGRCIASTETVSVGDNHTSRDYFQQAIQGKPYVSGVLVGQARGEPGVFFSSPVRSSSGEILGVAVLKIQGKTLWSTVNQVRADSHSQAFLVDENGIIINHPNESFLYNSLTPLPPNTLKQLASERNYSPDQMKSLNLPKLAAAMLRAREPGHISYYFSREQMYLTVGFAPVEVKPWVLGVSKPKANFAAPLNQLIVQEVSSVLVVGAIAAIIALLLAQSVARPIRALTQAAEALVYETEFDHQALAKASLMRDDVGQLVRVFLNMAQAVKTREQKLQQQVDALELRIEIDESKRAQQVAEITETDYFQDVQKEVQKLKTQPAKADETNTDFFEEMREKAQQLKDRTPKAES